MCIRDSYVPQPWWAVRAGVVWAGLAGAQLASLRCGVSARWSGRRGLSTPGLCSVSGLVTEEGPYWEEVTCKCLLSSYWPTCPWPSHPIGQRALGQSRDPDLTGTGRPGEASHPLSGGTSEVPLGGAYVLAGRSSCEAPKKAWGRPGQLSHPKVRGRRGLAADCTGSCRHF